MRRFATIAALGLFIIFSALRLMKWNAPLTTDEGYFLMNYADKSYPIIATTYNAPNNHILLAMLTHAIDEAAPKKLILSLADPWPLRLPSMLGSIATLALLFVVAQSLFNTGVALLAMTFLGGSFWHLIYSHMLRGYSLSAFFILLDVWLALGALQGRKREAFLLALSLAAGHYLIPVNAYFTLAMLPWLGFMLQRRKGASKNLLAAFAVGGLLTLALYWPVLAQLLKQSRAMQGALPDIASERAHVFMDVFGSGRGYRGALMALMSWGAVFIFLRRARWASPGGLIACQALVPLSILTLQGQVGFTRVFVPVLPFAAMLGAVGVYGLLIMLFRNRNRLRLALVGAAAAIVMASLGELRSFMSWNRGVDLLGPVRRIAALVREEDDFAAVFAPMPTTPVVGDSVDWIYYAFSAHWSPYANAVKGGDYPYLSRKEYFLVAQDGEELAGMMARSGLDSTLRDGVHRESGFGRYGLYHVSCGEDVRKAYLSAAGRSADAMRGLAAYAMRAGSYQEAIGWLSKAKRADPKDARTRHQLAMAYYLAWDDAKAIDEFSWVVVHDTENLHAPFYYADALAGVGERDQAKRWYEWYFATGKDLPQAWPLRRRAGLGLGALADSTAIKAKPVGEKPWFRLGKELMRRGAYERAGLAFDQSYQAGGDARALFMSAMADNELKSFHRVAMKARRLLDTSLSVEVRRLLSPALAKKFLLQEAAEVGRPLLDEETTRMEMQKAERQLRRMWAP